MYCTSSLIKAGKLYFILLHTARALYLNHSETSGGHLKLGEGKMKKGVGSELRVGAEYACMWLTVMQRKFNAGSRCDKRTRI